MPFFFFLNKIIKSKGNAVWGNKPVCKVGINDNKNKVLFLEKNPQDLSHFLSVKMRLFLRNMHSEVLSLLCTYVERCP